VPNQRLVLHVRCFPQIATLETGVLNIKSVLTRNTDPGLIAMTGVINLLVRTHAQACLLWSCP
jgi:hypothetical protein